MRVDYISQKNRGKHFKIIPTELLIKKVYKIIAPLAKNFILSAILFSPGILLFFQDIYQPGGYAPYRVQGFRN